MARAHFSDVAIDSQGNFIPACKVTVRPRGVPTQLASIYPTEVSVTPMDNPVLMEDGIVSFWADAGAYDVEIADAGYPPRVAPRVIGWGAVPGVQGGIPGSLIADMSVTSGKLADSAVTPPKVGIVPQTRVYHNAAVTIAHNTWTSLPHNSLRYEEVDNMWDFTANNFRLTARRRGLYHIGGSIEWPNNGAARRMALALCLNNNPGGTTGYLTAKCLNSINMAENEFAAMNIVCDYRMEIGETFELVAFQTSGGNMTIPASFGYHNEFWMRWISP